ncbi:pentatricopeptide repeat-containing protein At2g13420, mitochondrial-like [Euphorbia lathyris]|uniref:pentatricopeptide repeat-containing protein At2g13420, mitochondrial-like n=1 Tax=Euphorbia lathyris TaxID=212925 RepID=UPI00331327ED
MAILRLLFQDRILSSFPPPLCRLFSSSFPVLHPSNDAELLSQILLHHHNPFHSMESSLQLHGISLTSSLLHQTLLRLSNHSKIALSLFHYALSLPSSAVTSSATYDLIIDILSKVRQFDVSWQLMLDMESRHIHPTSNTFFILIRRLIAAGFTRQAIRAFDDMESFITETVDHTHFCFLLDTLSKYGYIKLAVEIFNKRKFRFSPNVRMYTVLIYGWCKIGRIDMAERFLKEMDERGIEANVVTYNVLLNGICRRASLHPEGRFERTINLAENVFEEMRQRGIEADITSYSILLHVYSRGHKPQMTLDKLKVMKEKGIYPSVVTYTSVIKCLCSCGRVEEAEELLCEMMRDGVCPNAATYNCFFKEYRGRKDSESALMLYRKMREKEVCCLSIQSYNILLGMFMKLNRMEVVKEIWEDLCRSSRGGPDLDSYTMLIHGLCEKNKWKEACSYFVEMIERGLLPQKVTFEMLYKGLIQSNKLTTWRRLKKRLDEESIAFGSEFDKYHLKPYRR